MGDTSQKGLGSDNMDPQTKHDIQSAGGQASHSGGNQSGQQDEQYNSDINRSSGGQGFAGMPEEEVSAIASKGGRSQGQDNNPGNFANDHEKAVRAGQKGGSR